MLSLPFVALLASQGQALDLRNIQAAALYSQSHRGSALLVLQDGKEIFAEAENRFDLSREHILASGSKSFSCTIAVALQAEGKLKLDEPVSQSVQEWQQDPQKSSITISQLLHFTSGLPGKIGPSIVRLNKDMYGTAINTPLAAEPGKVFMYGNSHLAVFGEVVKRKTGLDPAIYLQKHILDPLGVKASWQRDQKGNPNLAGSASMTARDWATFGQMVLQKGQWHGKQVLPAQELQKCFQGSEALSTYGLNWWLNVPFNGTLDAGDEVPVQLAKAGKDQQQIAPSAPQNVVMAAGAFNQRLYLLPDEHVVVVRFGEGGDWSDEAFLKLLLGK
ncbi:hypothetical protein GCM10008938_04460 [Deinococcus roseus]|uniref:Beta-lactamase-related domain-containing protein n=1 Tax=Deinococcus roseus TaxID=392414 RepID=A0ABQ2CVJ0_9DEIO|nr:hypothetical protein GCM10008938_04460 [Deinococcus roseus]